VPPRSVPNARAANGAGWGCGCGRCARPGLLAVPSPSSGSPGAGSTRPGQSHRPSRPICGAETPTVTPVLPSPPSPSRWVELDLEGSAANRSGIGARVILDSNGQEQLTLADNGQGHPWARPEFQTPAFRSRPVRADRPHPGHLAIRLGPGLSRPTGKRGIGHGGVGVVPPTPVKADRPLRRRWRRCATSARSALSERLTFTRDGMRRDFSAI
jgi:hypothetical protein